MTDLFQLFSKLVTPAGEILVPGINQLVATLTKEERSRYERMDFGLADINSATGSKTTLSEDKAEVLMGRMRYPSLSLHGIEGAFSGSGAKTVIPAAVHGKFSIRLVPDLTPEKVAPLVTKYLEEEFKKLNTKNTLKIDVLSGGKPWLSDPNHWYVFARKAVNNLIRSLTGTSSRAQRRRRLFMELSLISRGKEDRKIHCTPDSVAFR